MKNLNKEQEVSSFEILYLVDTNGNTYSSFNLISPESDIPYIERILNGENHFAMYYCGNEDEHTFMKRERVVYGITVEPVQVDDITVVGLIGMTDIQLMNDKLKVDSFGGRGHTGVIDKEGFFIVNIEGTKGLGKQDNIFDVLKEGTLLENETFDTVKEKVQSEEFCTIQYKNENDMEKILASVAIPDSEWLVLMTVEMSVFYEQNFEFTMMSTVLLIVVAGAFFIMLLIIFKSMLSFSRAEADSKVKGDFLSSMSHEIRTSLNGLIGLIHLMQKNKDDAGKLDGYLEKSSSTAQYLMTLVNDILDMQKLSQHSMTLEEKPFSLMTMLDTIETLMRSRMEENGISFVVDIKMINPAIIGDEIRIEQVLINILGNAVKFTPAGGRVTMTVRQSQVSESEIMTVFEITDTGCGMSEAFQKHIFDSFSQESRKTSDGTKGTGLGMAISYQFAKLMNGSLRVKSKLNEGSTFTFGLPVKCTDQLPDQPENIQTIDALSAFSILLAEDNDLNAEILIEVFSEMGFDVQRAGDGQEAVEMFRASEPGEYDVILMDVQMPVMAVIVQPKRFELWIDMMQKQ